MKFWEAMKALEEGKSVRLKEWPSSAYWSFKQTGYLGMTVVDLLVLASKEWEFYEDFYKNHCQCCGAKITKQKNHPATHALYLKCLECGLTDYVLKEDAKNWKCPSCPLANLITHWMPLPETPRK